MGLEPGSLSDTLWTARPGPSYPRLTQDLTVDVAIVGGGIVGLSTARLLAQSGRSVAILESRRIGRQITGGSTAKVTSQHSLAYRRIERTFGLDAARAYGQANQWGIEEISRVVQASGTDCSFVRRPAYAFTAKIERREELRDEADFACSIGLPARYVDAIPLSVPSVGAIVFDDQAQFDPYAYTTALAAAVTEAGGRIFEHTRVTDVEESAPHILMTEEGRVAAADVVVATGLPIVDLGEFFARTTPKAHLVLGARVNGAAPSGMFISLDEPTHSMRWEERADGTWLVVVGPKFQPGSQDTVTGFAELEAFAREHFPVISVEHRWWNMDFYSVEGMPYVGPMTEETPHLYVATGFSGWGLTTGTVAARVIADAITGTESEWASTFRSTRPVISDESPIASALGFVKENLITAKAFVSDRLSPPVDLAALPPGSGVVTHIDGEQVAVSRDDDGRLHAVSAVCTHLGCVVDWNAAMRTWDCGCHGSCFTADGAVLRGPARHDLEARTEHIQ